MSSLRTAINIVSRRSSRASARSIASAVKQRTPACRNFVLKSQNPTWANSFISSRHLSTSTADDFVLSHPSAVEGPNPTRGRVIVITSGKGGVGKTTSAASFAHGLASRGHKTCVVVSQEKLSFFNFHWRFNGAYERSVNII